MIYHRIYDKRGEREHIVTVAVNGIMFSAETCCIWKYPALAEVVTSDRVVFRRVVREFTHLVHIVSVQAS